METGLYSLLQIVHCDVAIVKRLYIRPFFTHMDKHEPVRSRVRVQNEALFFGGRFAQ